MKRTLALLVAILSVLQGTLAVAGSRAPTIRQKSVSGDTGHSFVYFEVTDSRDTSPAPTGNRPTRYYSVWNLHEGLDSTCPLLWVIPIFDRGTGQQINAAAPGIGTYGTRDHLCAKPSITPVGTSREVAAHALLSLDLRAWLAPPTVQASKPATVNGELSGRIQNDLNTMLSMSIRSWEVASWRVAFGDGTEQTYPGGTRSIRASHQYAEAGNLVATVTTHITGWGEAADYAEDGRPFIYTRPFSVDVSNRTDGRVVLNPVIRHVPPVLAVGGAPAIADQAPAAAALAHIEALRGLLTAVYPRLILIQPGYLVQDDIRIAEGATSLTAWEYLGGINDAPLGIATPSGAQGGPDQPIRVQWNRPNPVQQGTPKDYAIPLRLFARTHFPDGFFLDQDITGGVAVSVRYTAISH